MTLFYVRPTRFKVTKMQIISDRRCPGKTREKHISIRIVSYHNSCRKSNEINDKRSLIAPINTFMFISVYVYSVKVPGGTEGGRGPSQKSA